MQPKIGIVFDFDKTLSPQFQQREIFNKWGIDEGQFWQECSLKIANEGYDMEHGYLKNLIDYAHKKPAYHLSNQDLFDLGKSIALFDGLSKKDHQPNIFDDIDELLKSPAHAAQNIQVEYYCISGGLTPMIQGAFSAHKIDQHFKHTYACLLDENEAGIIHFPKETIGHTLKTQKLFQISKGLDQDVNKRMQDYTIPFSNMIYLGDGQTDIPAFALLRKMGGVSIAVHPEFDPADARPDSYKKLMEYMKIHEFAVQENRVHQLLPANYSKGQPLHDALLKYVNEICESIKEQKPDLMF